jgi:hypothetical protein
MSCGCNNSTYSSTCCPEVPYPSISSESVPSLIDNLVYALYGTIEKSITGGRVVWNIPCDPSTSPAEVAGIPREEGEGLMCYIIRVLNEDVVVIPNVVDTISAQTITGQKTFTQDVIAPNIVNIAGSQTITGQKTFTQSIIGNVIGNITGNLTGNVTGNVSGSASVLSTARTVAISGDVTGTATSFDGSANISIPATISSGASISSPVFSGTATGSLTSKVISGVVDASSATSGFIGEIISGSSTAASIASNTIANGATITLTPGDWDLSGSSTFNFSGVTVTANSTIASSISTTSGSLTVDQQQLFLLPAYTTATATPAFAISVPRVTLNVSVNTTVYLVVKSPVTSAGTITFSSRITARRIR